MQKRVLRQITNAFSLFAAFFAIDFDRTALGTEQTEQDFKQSGLAGAVASGQG